MEDDDGDSDGVAERKPTATPLTLLEILLLSSVVCGVELCSNAGFTYISPMLLKVGLSESWMSVVVGFGPLLCLIFVPYIGRASDRLAYFW